MPVTFMDGFEEQVRQRAPAWSVVGIRMIFQGYLERGFVGEKGDLESLTSLLGHPPRLYDTLRARRLSSCSASRSKTFVA